MLFSLFTLIKDLVRNAMINRLFGPVALPKPQIHLRMRESKNWVRKKSECSQNIKNQITPWHVPARTIHIFLMCSPLRAIFFFFSLIEIILGEVTWVLFWRLYTGIITLPRILLCLNSLSEERLNYWKQQFNSAHPLCLLCVSHEAWAGTTQIRINKLNHIKGCWITLKDKWCHKDLVLL